MAPGLKFVHPGCTGLDDLLFLEPFVPITVGHLEDILRFLIGLFDGDVHPIRFDYGAAG